MRYPLVIAAALVCALSGPARAGGGAPSPIPAAHAAGQAALPAPPAGPPPAGRAISLDQALAAAGQAPEPRAAAARTRAAEVAVSAAGAWPATEVGISRTIRQARAVFTALVPVPIFGRLGASKRTARAGLDVARADQSSVDLNVRRKIMRAWFALAAAEAKAAQAQAAADRAGELADVAKKRFDAGDAPHGEVVTADASAADARAQAASARIAISAASADLAGALGWDPGTSVRAQGELPRPTALPPLRDLRARAERHPQLRAAQARVALSRARVERAQRERWPQLALDLEADVDDPTIPGSDFRGGVLLYMPLFGKTGAAEQEAKERVRAATLAQESARRDVDARVVAAYRRYQAAATRARALIDKVVPAQREATKLAEEGYRQGHSGLVAVIQAQRELVRVDTSLVTANANAATALADLEWAVGGPI